MASRLGAPQVLLRAVFRGFSTWSSLWCSYSFQSLACWKGRCVSSLSEVTYLHRPMIGCRQDARPFLRREGEGEEGARLELALTGNSLANHHSSARSVRETKDLHRGDESAISRFVIPGVPNRMRGELRTHPINWFGYTRWNGSGVTASKQLLGNASIAPWCCAIPWDDLSMAACGCNSPRSFGMPVAACRAVSAARQCIARFSARNCHRTGLPECGYLGPFQP